jgi:hypothetical protein
MPDFDELLARTDFVRAQAIEATQWSGMRLRTPPAAAALTTMNLMLPAPGMRRSKYCAAARRSSACRDGCTVTDCLDHPYIDAILADCCEHLCAREPVVGCVAILFVIETIDLDRHRDKCRYEERAAALRSVVNLAANGANGAEMLEAYAFFIFDLIISIMSEPHLPSPRRSIGVLHL